MAKNNKKRLIENFKRVSGVTLKEWSDNPNIDSNQDYTNQELRKLIGDMLSNLRFYRTDIAANILTAELEEKYPQLKGV
jgi:hypothetical protein